MPAAAGARPPPPPPPTTAEYEPQEVSERLGGGEGGVTPRALLSFPF